MEGSTPPSTEGAAPKAACAGGAAEQTGTEATDDALSACLFVAVADDGAESGESAGSVCAALTSDGEEEETCEAG